MDMFELTLGNRPISHGKYSAGDGLSKAVRMIKSFNYVTMGGQFVINGMSEVGAGIYAGCFFVKGIGE